MPPQLARITRKVIRLPDGQYAWSVAAWTRLIASGIERDRATAMAAAHLATPGVRIDGGGHGGGPA